MKNLIFLFGLIVSSAFATIAPTTQWDVRTTGSDTNGGCWDPASTGTDRSQQNAAYIAFTDLTIGGTTTQATSAAHPFDSTSPGSCINTVSGSGCTVGRRQIVSVASAVATFERSLGTAGSVCTSNLGGALATPDPAIAALTASSNERGQVVHIQTGTYTRTTSLASPSEPMTFIGYQTTHLDGGTRPLITISTNSTPLIFTGGGTEEMWVNVSFSNTATTRSYGFKSNSGGAYNYIVLLHCVLDGFSWGVIADNSLSSAGYVLLVDNEIKNCTLGGASSWFGMEANYNYIHDNSGPGIQKTSNQEGAVLFLSHNVIARNTKGVDVEATNINLRMLNNNVVSNTGDGVYNVSQGQAPLVQNNVFYDNGGYGYENTDSATAQILTQLNTHNAWGANVSGDVLRFTKNTNDIALTADPFNAKATGDFGLNGAAGGGSLLKKAAYPGSTFVGGSAMNYDIGAIQTSGALVPVTHSFATSQ